MNKLEKFLINLIPKKEYRKILRNELSKKSSQKETEFQRYFVDLTNTMDPCNENCKFFNEYSEFFGIKFLPMKNYFGIVEAFGRRDYEFGGLNNAVFIDVGANIGDSVLYAAMQKNIQKVYAYEPFQKTYNFAVKNVNLNPEYKNKIKLFNFGWGKDNVELEVKTNNDINLSAINSTQEFFHAQNLSEYIEKTNIIIKKSSEILKEILITHPNDNIVLKLDIEGSEYDVLEDLINADLLKYISIIVVEWHFKGYENITKQLEQNNFIWFNEKFMHNVGLLRAVNLKKIVYNETN